MTMQQEHADEAAAYYRRLGGANDRAHRAGRCPHGWLNAPAAGPVTCRDCGATWATMEDALQAHRDVLEDFA